MAEIASIIAVLVFIAALLVVGDLIVRAFKFVAKKLVAFADIIDRNLRIESIKRQHYRDLWQRDRDNDL